MPFARWFTIVCTDCGDEGPMAPSKTWAIEGHGWAQVRRDGGLVELCPDCKAAALVTAQFTAATSAEAVA